MSDNNATNNAINENRPTVSGKEKRKLFAGPKEKINAFAEEHQKGCGIAKKVLKGLGLAAATIGSFAVGCVVGSHNSSNENGIDLIETVDVFDDAPVEDAVDNNDNN